MDSISNTNRSDVVLVESAPRPTPTPARVAFSDVLSAGASNVVQGAEVAMSKLPGSPVSAAAVRTVPGSNGLLLNTGSATTSAAEGPSPILGVPSTSLGGSTGGSLLQGTSGSTIPGLGASSGTDPTSGIEGAMQQSASLNIYYLQLQQQEDAQNRVYTAQSNILKTEHDSAKNAIGNIHS